MDNWAVSTF